MDKLKREIAAHGRAIQALVLAQRRLEERLAAAQKPPAEAWIEEHTVACEGTTTCSDCLTRLYVNEPILPFVAGETPRKKLVAARKASEFRDAHEATAEELRRAMYASGITPLFSIAPERICDQCLRSGKTFVHIIGTFFLCDYRVTRKRRAEASGTLAKKVCFLVPS